MKAASAIAAAAVMAATGCVQRVPASFDAARISELSCRRSSTASTNTWIGPADRSAIFQLSRWCGTVGPVLFHPVPAVEAAPSDQLVVVSWNVHEGGGDLDDLIHRLRAGAFTGGEPVSQFALLLQEAIRGGDEIPRNLERGAPVPGRIQPNPHSGRADVRRLADQGFSVLYAPSMRNGMDSGRPEDGPEDRGNAIVSTLRLSDPRMIELPLQHQRRVAIAATVEGRRHTGAPWRLDLVDVHLDTALAPLHGGPASARARQASALEDALGAFARRAETPAGTIIGGDLNTWTSRHERAVAILGKNSAHTPPADGGPTWQGPLGLRASLDHLFVRGAASSDPVRLSSRFGSDHYPLLTIVRLEER